jgi:AraC family transcriptional regulator, positive regulator of tynA and feaB
MPRSAEKRPLNYEEWTETLRSMCGRYNPEGTEPRQFSGWIRPLDVCGVKALDIGANAARIERTYHDVRKDGADHYFVIFQLGGEAGLKHNEQAVWLSMGDVALMDATRPARYLGCNADQAWNNVTLNLPRAALISHLGFEPRAGNFRQAGSPAGRLLLNLIRSSDEDEWGSGGMADTYMQWAIYDLVGALFAPAEPLVGSRHSEKLFVRIRELAQRRIEDPDFGPVELAAAAGISLRYAQKLFTARGLTCSEFIYSLRLERAALLLQRRAARATDEPLSVIAYACGFRDYSHFARKFRQRFGYPPGAHDLTAHHNADCHRKRRWNSDPQPNDVTAYAKGTHSVREDPERQ